MAEIRAARPDEFDSVREFYCSVIDALQDAEYGPAWKKGIYPSDEDLADAVQKEELFIGTVGDRIVSAMRINGDFGDGYSKVSWPTRAEGDEIEVIHLLCVHPDHLGRGFAKELVSFAVDHAKRSGKKVIRLDVLDGNVPAERLYTGVGFEYVDTAVMYYEDTGHVSFKLYEYRV